MSLELIPKPPEFPPIDNRRLSDEEFENISIVACVDIIVCSSEGILLTVRNIDPFIGLWHLPGGRIFPYETRENAVQRIAQREFGQRVEIIDDQFGTNEMPNDGIGKITGRVRHSIASNFLVRCPQQIRLNTKEASQCGYFWKLPWEKMHPYQGPFLWRNRERLAIS